MPPHPPSECTLAQDATAYGEDKNVVVTLSLVFDDEQRLLVEVALSIDGAKTLRNRVDLAIGEAERWMKNQRNYQP